MAVILKRRNGDPGDSRGRPVRGGGIPRKNVPAEATRERARCGWRGILLRKEACTGREVVFDAEKCGILHNRSGH